MAANGYARVERRRNLSWVMLTQVGPQWEDGFREETPSLPLDMVGWWDTWGRLRGLGRHQLHPEI